MERSDIQKHVLEYAASVSSPFTAAQAFDNIDAIETAKQVSDALGRLYNQRILARRKIDKIRYEYVMSEKRTMGFEMAPDQPTAEPKAAEPENAGMKTKNNIGSAESATTGIDKLVKMTKASAERADAIYETMKNSSSTVKNHLTAQPDGNRDDEQATPAIKHQQPPIEQKTETQPDWLKIAHDIVHGDREKTYGDPGKNLRLIAQYWSAHTGITITETDVCIMMQLLKIARLKNNPEHSDSWIDIAGYTALKNKLVNACKQKATS